MHTREELKEKLMNLAEETLEVSKESLSALRVLIPEASVKDLNTLYNNSLKNHKIVLDQILSIEQEEREERINAMKELDLQEVDLSKYELEV